MKPSLDSHLVVRPETSSDREAVWSVNVAAFEGDAEARLVQALHESGAVVVSLVAVIGDDIVGHILFSEVSAEKSSGQRIAGLAPMAVAPPRQRQGIGSRLVEGGLKALASHGFSGVVVLGHPEYYPRFGFRPAIHFGLGTTWDVPPGVFMARELPGHSLADVSGLVHYHPAFDSL